MEDNFRRSRRPQEPKCFLVQEVHIATDESDPLVLKTSQYLMLAASAQQCSSGDLYRGQLVAKLREGDSLFNVEGTRLSCNNWIGEMMQGSGVSTNDRAAGGYGRYRGKESTVCDASHRADGHGMYTIPTKEGELPATRSNNFGLQMGMEGKARHCGLGKEGAKKIAAKAFRAKERRGQQNPRKEGCHLTPAPEAIHRALPSGGGTVLKWPSQVQQDKADRVVIAVTMNQLKPLCHRLLQLSQLEEHQALEPLCSDSLEEIHQSDPINQLQRLAKGTDMTSTTIQPCAVFQLSRQQSFHSDGLAHVFSFLDMVGVVAVSRSCQNWCSAAPRGKARQLTMHCHSTEQLAQMVRSPLRRHYCKVMLLFPPSASEVNLISQNTPHMKSLTIELSETVLRFFAGQSCPRCFPRILSLWCSVSMTHI
jgi:hypothetical protein